MVEPVFFKQFDRSPSVGGQLLLDGEEGKHAASVRRMRVGELIALTNGKGLRVRGSVESVEAKSLSVSVTEVIEEPRPELQIVLIQALAKGDRDELAIQAATELGAMTVIPWQAERSISRWDESKSIKGQARWQTICDEAAKQSLRVWFPKVGIPATTKQIVANIQEFDQVLVLDPSSAHGISSLGKLSGTVAIVVGPEGGIDPQELAMFEAAGATRVRLGTSILRTSTAGVVAISALQAAAGHFG